MRMMAFVLSKLMCPTPARYRAGVGGRAGAAGLRRLRAGCAAGLLMLLSSAAFSESQAPDLSREFQVLAIASYKKLANESGPCPSFSELEQQLSPAQSLSPSTLGCLLQQLEAIEEARQIKDPARLSQALLHHGLSQPLEQLLEHQALQNRQRISGQIQFYLAQHAFERGDWQTSTELTQALGNHFSLSADQRQFLLLTRALKLQRQSKHRQAIRVYEQFEPGHPYHPEARTNLAIAYLKQGWWTDGHRELEKLLQLPEEHALDEEFKNRLRMLLGLSQLQQGFYRNARRTFRAITLDSQYVGYAWRGIGLSAFYQEDYPSALNAFLRLKEMDDPELPEGPFLVGFAYDQMNSLALAEASYTEAMLGYQNQLQAIERDRNKLAGHWLPETPPSRTRATHLMSGELMAATDYWRDYQALKRLETVLADNGIAQEERDRVTDLRARYQKQLAEFYQAQLEERKQHLESYLSQSQYGLATIYDRK